MDPDTREAFVAAVATFLGTCLGLLLKSALLKRIFMAVVREREEVRYEIERRKKPVRKKRKRKPPPKAEP